MKRKIKLLAVVLALLAFTGCTQESIPELKPSIGTSVDTCVVLRGDVEKKRAYTAYVVPEYVELEAVRSGVVDNIYFWRGDAVEAGDVIAEIGTEGLLEQREELEERLEQARESWDMQVEMAYYDVASASARRGIPGTDEEMLELSIQQAQAACSYYAACRDIQLGQMERELERMDKAIEESRICAPCKGVVADLQLSKDMPVGSGTVVARVAKENSEYLFCDSGDNALAKTEEPCRIVVDGEDYEVRLIPYSEEDYRTAVLKGSVPAKFRLPVGADVKLGDRVLLLVQENFAKDALYVPVDAVMAIGTGRSGSYVYVLNGEGERVHTEVEIDFRTDAWVVLSSGVEEGDVLYVPTQA